MSMEKSPYPGMGTIEDPYVVTFLPGDMDNPKNWSLVKRWVLLGIYALGMMSGTFSVSSYTSGFAGMIKEFNTTLEVLSIGQMLFLYGLGFGSLIWPASGDIIGRRQMGIITLTIFALFSIGTAAAKNMQTVLISRFFSGFFGAGIQTLGPSSLGNLFLPQKIAVPFTIAAIAPFLGPSVGPLVGGYVTQYTGSWRNINWVAVGFAGVMAFLSLFVPELYGPTLLRRKAEALSKETGAVYISAHDVGVVRADFKTEASRYILKPLVYLIKEPIIFLFCLYVAFLYAILQIYFTAFPRIYEQARGWDQATAGLPFVALIIGYILAVPTTIYCGRPYMRRLKRDGKVEPEHRLYFAILSAVLLPISLFWMAWTATPSVHWINPVIAGGIFGFSQIGVMMSIFVYLTDVYTIHVGAVFAGMNFMRFSLSGVFPLFARQLYERLGTAWACSLLGFLLLVFMPVPALFFKYGPTIRSYSKIAKSGVKKDVEAAKPTAS